MVSMVFNWNLLEAESRIFKHSSEQRELQLSELLMRLNIFECLSEGRCLWMRVVKCLLVSPT